MTTETTSSASDTPLTDKVVLRRRPNRSDKVPADFARKPERRLHASIALLAQHDEAMDAGQDGIAHWMEKVACHIEEYHVAERKPTKQNTTAHEPRKETDDNA